MLGICGRSGKGGGGRTITFLMANSDSPDVPLDAESIATYAALERLVDADQNLKDFQKKLLACLAVVEAHEWSSELRAELTPDREPHDAVAPWLKDLYVLRGNAGHGYPIAKLRSATWEQHEHLLAGAFVYPLALTHESVSKATLMELAGPVVVS